MAYLYDPQTGQLVDSTTGQPVPTMQTLGQGYTTYPGQTIYDPTTGQGGNEYLSPTNPNSPSYNPIFDPNSPYYGYQSGPIGSPQFMSLNAYMNQGTQGASTGGAAPTYDPSNPAPYINYFYHQRYGTDAPPDQIQYWSDKLANPTQLGNGQMSTPSYYMNRLLYDNTPNAAAYGAQNGQSSGGLGLYGTQFAPLFQPSAPFTYGQGVPNVGAFSYNPLQTPGQFTAPTGQDALNADPGYQFRLQQGLSALQNSAAARGALGDPNTLRAVEDYGQGAASQEYSDAYNRALQTYQANTGTNLAAQQQQYQQGLGAFTTNAQTQLAQQQQGFNQALQGYQTNFQDPLAAYQANVGAQLGYGQLGLGYTNAGINQGYLGLAANQQAFQQPYSLAELGLQATQGSQGTQLGYYNTLAGLGGQQANLGTGLITGAGNAQAGGIVGAANSGIGAANNLGNLGLGLGAYAANQPWQAQAGRTVPQTSIYGGD